MRSDSNRPEFVQDGAQGRQEYLYEKLQAYCGSEAYPFHMPGHKRKLGSMADPFSFDITEIDGFDNLHHAEEILLEAQQRAAKLYGSDAAYFLINGSTAGILTAVSAVCGQGEKILMARNAHKSAYHAVYLRELDPVYLWPQSYESGISVNGRISPEDVERELKQNPDIRGVFIVSPTYDGIVSDVQTIAEIAHAHGAALIVDEAHGAHLGFSEKLPPSAVTQGADLVIQSLHKTLPSLTQTALLHVNLASGLVDPDRVKRFSGIYQTSSPSYVLMASIDECIRIMQEQGRSLMEKHLQNLERFYEATADLKQLEIIRTDDCTKVLIGTERAGLSGLTICDILRNKYGLEAEMAAVTYVLALTSVGDTREGLDRLAGALSEIDAKICAENELRNCEQICEADHAAYYTQQNSLLRSSILRRKPLAKAWDAPYNELPLKESAGHISGDFLYLYPPGIPMVVPGEQISGELLERVLKIRDAGYSLQGMADLSGQRIRCLL